MYKTHFCEKQWEIEQITHFSSPTHAGFHPLRPQVPASLFSALLHHCLNSTPNPNSPDASLFSKTG